MNEILKSFLKLVLERHNFEIRLFLLHEVCTVGNWSYFETLMYFIQVCLLLYHYWFEIQYKINRLFCSIYWLLVEVNLKKRKIDLNLMVTKGHWHHWRNMYSRWTTIQRFVVNISTVVNVDIVSGILSYKNFLTIYYYITIFLLSPINLMIFSQINFICSIHMIDF